MTGCSRSPDVVLTSAERVTGSMPKLSLKTRANFAVQSNFPVFSCLPDCVKRLLKVGTYSTRHLFQIPSEKVGACASRSAWV